MSNFIMTRRRLSRVSLAYYLVGAAFNVKRNLNSLAFPITNRNPAKNDARASLAGCHTSAEKNFLNRLGTVVSATVLRPITNQNEGSSAESTTKQSEPAS